MKKNYFFLFIIVLISFSSHSCKSKKIAYFQDLEYLLAQEKIIMQSAYNDITIKPKDELTIIVSTADPDASLPFNLNFKEGTLDPAKGETRKLVTYIVDNEGYISFPTLGKIKMEGSTIQEAIIDMEKRLKHYITDPIVSMMISNFQVSVIGAVEKPGPMIYPNQKVSILEALANAGDLTIYGRPDNILLIRENSKGEKEFIRFDITKSEVFSSPYYYLQQNDIIYVEPNKTYQQDSNMGSSKQFTLTIVTSTISTIISTISLIIALNRK